MTDRVRVAITTGAGGARVTSLDRLKDLLEEELWEYGPEPEGVVVEINPAALDELPEGWIIEEIPDE